MPFTGNEPTHTFEQILVISRLHAVPILLVYRKQVVPVLSSDIRSLQVPNSSKICLDQDACTANRAKTVINQIFDGLEIAV